MMKKLFLILFVFAIHNSLIAQDTYTINWTFGSNSDVTPTTAVNNADRTIEVGDTVEWNFISPGSHNVANKAGSQETFSSPGLQGAGFVFSHTFTQIGTNDYQCDPHPGSMFGTITVVADGTLSLQKDEILNAVSIYPSLASTYLNIKLPTQIDSGLSIEVYDVLGKKVLKKTINRQSAKTISVSSLNNGLYIIKIISTEDNVSVTKRFIKI